MIKKIRNLMILILILVLALRFPSMQYYYGVCKWMSGNETFIYVPMHTCIYQEGGGSSSWQVVTWLDAIPGLVR